ncbi:15557_t:CDS:2, partial [Gigaspora rosea]
YVPLDLLTTGYFTGNYNNGYDRFDLANIAANIAGNADAKGAYNYHALSYDRYILYKTHKNDLTSYFPSNFNRGARRKRHDWESVEDDPTTILLDKTNFPEEMNEHFAAAHNGGIGQGNLTCQNADGRSRQVSFRLWFDKVFITPKMIKEKQKLFNKMRFEPRYLIEIDEANQI